MSTGEKKSTDLVNTALYKGFVIPGFNIPYIPMMEPVVQALRDTNSFGFMMVARLEWIKFEAGSLESIYDEYQRLKDPNFTRLHLDHIPVLDEDGFEVDYIDIINRAIERGYDSVMVDGSRLPLEKNIQCTKQIVKLAHDAGIPVEAELGAVLGHEEGPLPPYEELFESGAGFTDVDEARHYVRETGVDWLSVAIGNVHGAIAASQKNKKKVQARLDIERLKEIFSAVKIPLVLHGGTGIKKEYISSAIQHGIAKINIGTAIRQPYENKIEFSLKAAQEAVYQTTRCIIREKLEIENSANFLK
ncbi:class II fructose-bisphosphate aldolase [candidate division KSB1 bacterium]|nr:class II fructose-bisphosphate aldolase [candidate division KSB1 bacterium]